MPTPIRVRFSPSPTGFLHIGGLRTALYNELFAKKHNGTFVLRLEDTDRTRFVEGASERLCTALRTMGVIPDEGVWLDPKGRLMERGDFGPYVQSKRQERHKAYAQELVRMGKAYYCFCTEEQLTTAREEQQAAGLPTGYNRACRGLPPEQSAKRVSEGESHVIRLGVPLQGAVSFHDEIRGDVSFDWKQVDDQVIIKSDGMATYHLANTCDDHDMAITHVIRGEEWVSSTPKHLFIYNCFGWIVPLFAHLPLLLNADRSKLSKRQGDVAVEDYVTKGYLPEALLNFVALLGWNPSGDRELYTHEELRARFDLQRVNKGGAVVNFEKLDWMNAQYLRALPKEAYLELAGTYLHDLTDDIGLMDRVALLARDRIHRLTDLPNVVQEYTVQDMNIDPSIIPWKTQTLAEAHERLVTTHTVLASLDPAAWEKPETLERPIKELIQSYAWGNGEVLWPLRVVLSGQKQSPGPFELLYALGRERSLARIAHALSLLS
jgi:glutamyl-tRNA synthetase